MSVDDFVKKVTISFMEFIRTDHSSNPDSVEKAYIELKRWIFNHLVVPGQKLIYQDLADHLGMSKTPVISALNRLEYEGFVSRKLNRGYFIRGMSRKEIDELFDTREAIEVFSMTELIENVTDAQLEELDRIVEYHSQTDYMDMRKRLIVDIGFHLRMSEIVNNSRLFKMLQGLFEYIFLTYRFKKASLSRKISAEKEHRELLEAIKNKDVTNAKKLMGKHVRNGKNAILESPESFRIYSERDDLQGKT
jgi:DNA-binding GntR family transcriptional regulator